MKGESRSPGSGRGRKTVVDPAAVALQVLDRIVSDPDRLGRFLAMTGLDPATIRLAASGPDFLAAVLDHVVADEPLLLSIADEAGLRPADIADAQARLSPVADWSP